MKTRAVAASSDAPGVQLGEGGSQPTLPLHTQDRLLRGVPGMRQISIFGDESFVGRPTGPVSVPNRVIDPLSIRVIETSISRIASLQPWMSRATWRPSGFRQRGFLVLADGDLLGILALSATPLHLGPRDRALNLPSDAKEKGEALRHYTNLSVCVSAQPIGWHWNLGKLLALLGTTCCEVMEDRYGDEIFGVTTTSLYGRGSQYNRVYRFLGYTLGHGHEHISDAEYHRMVRWLMENQVSLPTRRITNVRMRRIQAYVSASGDSRLIPFHGNRRAIYYRPKTSVMDRPRVIQEWFERWGRPRYDRTKDTIPPYSNGVSILPFYGIPA